MLEDKRKTRHFCEQYHKHYLDFKEIFGEDLNCYWEDHRVGLDINKFSLLIKPEINESLQDAVNRLFGERGCEIFLELTSEACRQDY